MRYIPSELKTKIEKKHQTYYENANPNLKVLLSRGFINELFQVFTIQEGATLEDVDVTVKRTDTSNEPAEAFALTLDNGTATVKSKTLPYDDQTLWVDEFTAGTDITAVAIEFDGYWYRDPGLVRFNFVTEEFPWLFYVQGGSLMTRYWQDAAFVLSTDVVKVASIRGWVPANGVSTNDQGLIVAYTKTDGSMYYRSYCLQSGLNKIWEIERQVTAFTGLVSNLALFRTNDYRVGFMAEIAGDVWWTVTKRNYANMAVEPHFVSAGITDIKVDFIPITLTERYLEHKISVGISIVGVNFGPPQDPQAINAKTDNENIITIEFDMPLMEGAGQQNAFVVTDDYSNRFNVSSTELGETPYYLILHTESLIGAVTYLNVVFRPIQDQVQVGMLRTQMTPNCIKQLTDFDLQIELKPPEGYSDHNVEANITDVVVDFKKTQYTDAYQKGTHTVSAAITDVSVNFVHIDDIDP